MNSSTSDTEQVLNDIIVYVYRYAGSILFILGNLGNILSGVIFAKKTWRKNVCVFYFTICLILNSSFGNSYIIGGILIEGFNTHAHHHSAFLCKMYHYSNNLCATLLPAILISASFDRLLITSQNIETRLYSSKRLAYLSVSLCTIFWVVVNIHILIKVNIQQIGPWISQCFYDTTKIYLQFISYFFLIITCSYCLTMIILSKLAFKNIRHIRPVPRQQRKQMRTMTKKDFQLLRSLFVYDIVYILCTIVLSFYYVYLISGLDRIQTSLEATISGFLEKFLNFIRFIPFCTCFVIFMAVSKAFRNELHRMIWSRFGQTPPPIREEENPPNNIEKDTVHLNVVLPS